MEGFYHPDLGFRRTTSDNDGKFGKSVDFLLRQGIELLTSHYSAFWMVVPKDSNSLGDGRSRCRVISCEHSSCNTGLSGLEDGSSAFGSRWIVDACKSKESKTLFQLVSGNSLDSFRGLMNDFARKTQNSQTFGCKLRGRRKFQVSNHEHHSRTPYPTHCIHSLDDLCFAGFVERYRIVSKTD